MQNIKIVLLILFSMTSLSIADDHVKKHPHDLANENIRDGDYAQAVIFSQQALACEQTAQGYNTLGLSYENLAQYDLAIEAYTNGIKLAPDNSSIRKNRSRTIIRRFFWKYRDTTQSAFVASLSLLILIILSKHISISWRNYCIKRKYRCVKVKQIEFLAYDQKGQLQSDGRVYHDTRKMTLKFSLAVPERNDIYPMTFELNLKSPDNKLYRKTNRSITLSDKYNRSVSLEIDFDDDLIEILKNDGCWSLVAILGPNGKTLFVNKIDVISKAMLLENLFVSNKALLAINDNQVIPETVIPEDTQAVCSYIAISPRNYLASKYEDLTMETLLFSPNSSIAISSMSIPLDFGKGVQEISLEHPLANLSCDEKRGRWKFQFKIENRTLTTISFDVISRRQALVDFKLSDATLVGIGPKGGVFPLENITYRRPKTITPLFSFTTGVVSQLLSVPVSIGVCVDNDPVAEYADTIQLVDGKIDWIPGEYELPEWEEARQEMEVSFILFVDWQAVITKNVTIRKRAPYCADSQGRLTNIRSFQVSPSEAFEILQEAQVR